MGLPGDIVTLIHINESCEGSCEGERIATKRMQGETDSFGAEYMYFCDDCCEAMKKTLEDHVIEDNCDWCKEMAEVGPIRDWEEGMNGPVYYVCSKCRSEQNKELLELYQDEY